MNSILEHYRTIFFVEEGVATRIDSLSIADFAFEVSEELKKPFPETLEFFNKNQQSFQDEKCLLALLDSYKHDLDPADDFRLVIFDLDDTLWSGTLAEKTDISIKLSMINLVRELVEKGIMVSICSRNEFKEAQEVLETFSIWNLFVFPSISFGPKGPAIKEIIHNFQLRPENVLFVDNDQRNLKEAVYYNKKLNVCEPPELLDRLAHVLDNREPSSSRLHQYKILEKKHVAKTEFETPEEFLKNSNIRVTLRNPQEEDYERIEELIKRTNQLNFTKNRTFDVYQHLKNAVVVEVKDDFGDYGIVGFASWDAHFHHLLFSCRIMGMGVEQEVYKHIITCMPVFMKGIPHLDVVFPVASDLNSPSDWVTILRK